LLRYSRCEDAGVAGWRDDCPKKATAGAMSRKTITALLNDKRTPQSEFGANDITRK